MATAGNATPAALNPLTKLRRLAEPGLLGEFSRNFSYGAMWLLLPGIGLGLTTLWRGLTVTFWPLARDNGPV